MPDPYQPVQPGEPVTFSATAWNARIEAARAGQFRQLDRRSDDPGQLRQGEIVRVRNDTGVDLPRRSVVGLDGPLWSPSDSLDAFLREVTFAANIPGVGHVGKFGILVEPAPVDRVVRAVVAGVTQVQVNVSDEDHTCAEVNPGSTEALRSAAEGSAQILWREKLESEGYGYGYEDEPPYDDGGPYGPSTGRQWALVRLGTTCVECAHTLVLHFGPLNNGGPFTGAVGIAWRIDHVTGSGTTTVASGTTTASGFVQVGYTPTGDDESYVVVYQSPKLVGQGFQAGTVEIQATVVPPHTHDCRVFVAICPACVEVTGCCDTAYAYEDPTVTISGGPLVRSFDFDGLIDGDILDHPYDAFGLAHYVVGCVYLPEGTYTVDVTDPDLPPTAAPKTLLVDCVNNPYNPPNDVQFDLDFTPTATGNPDVSEHLDDLLTLSDGTGNDVSLSRPAPVGIPGRRELWWGCKVWPGIKTVDWSISASGGTARCDGRYLVAKPTCTVSPYDDVPVLEMFGADVAMGYLFDGCTLTIYALRCEYPQFVPPECLLKSGYQCDDLIAALTGHGPAPTPPAPPNGFTEVSTLATLTSKPTECYPVYRWEKTMAAVSPCNPVTDAELFDPVTHQFYFFHYVLGCPVDRDWAMVFYPGGATFVIVPAT